MNLYEQCGQLIAPPIMPIILPDGILPILPMQDLLNRPLQQAEDVIDV